MLKKALRLHQAARLPDMSSDSGTRRLGGLAAWLEPQRQLQVCFSEQLRVSHGHYLFNGFASTTELSTYSSPRHQPKQGSTHSVVIGLSFRPLRCSRIWTSTRRVDSVQMEHICRTTPITTKLSSPAG